MLEAHVRECLLPLVVVKIGGKADDEIDKQKDLKI